LKERRSKAEAHSSSRAVNTNQIDLSAMTSNSAEIQQVRLEEASASRRRGLTNKEINENRAEKNVLYGVDFVLYNAGFKSYNNQLRCLFSYFLYPFGKSIY